MFSVFDSFLRFRLIRCFFSVLICKNEQSGVFDWNSIRICCNSRTLNWPHNPNNKISHMIRMYIGKNIFEKPRWWYFTANAYWKYRWETPVELPCPYGSYFRAGCRRCCSRWCCAELADCCSRVVTCYRFDCANNLLGRTKSVKKKYNCRSISRPLSRYLPSMLTFSDIWLYETKGTMALVLLGDRLRPPRLIAGPIHSTMSAVRFKMTSFKTIIFNFNETFTKLIFYFS